MCTALTRSSCVLVPPLVKTKEEFNDVSDSIVASDELNIATPSQQRRELLRPSINERVIGFALKSTQFIR